MQKFPSSIISLVTLILMFGFINLSIGVLDSDLIFAEINEEIEEVIEDLVEFESLVHRLSPSINDDVYFSLSAQPHTHFNIEHKCDFLEIDSPPPEGTV